MTDKREWSVIASALVAGAFITIIYDISNHYLDTLVSSDLFFVPFNKIISGFIAIIGGLIILKYYLVSLLKKSLSPEK